MSIVAELADTFSKLSGGEAKELRMLLKDRLGIEAPGGSALPPQKPQEPVVVEPTEFNVVYEGFDLPKKIGLIKVMREFLGLALGDAKNLVEGGKKTLKEGLDKASADTAKAKLEEAGAKISVVPV
jgi:large subunit ribosomal protein L7/L12